MTLVRPADALVVQACDETGLDDFGDGAHREALDVLVESVNAEVDLTETGTAVIEGSLTGWLATRLRVEAFWGEHPELDEVPIDGPTLVVGLPRSGTTALVGMLAEDPAFRPLRHWEAATPLPPPEPATEADDPRVLAASAMAEQLAPEIAALHIFDPLGPEEDFEIFNHTFRGGHYPGFWPVYRYPDWWLSCDTRPAFAYHERLLKLLGSRRPPSSWLLKQPCHLFDLDTFAAQYPGARFVMTHRDPAKTIPSLCSLEARSFKMVTERVDLHRHGAYQAGYWAEGARRALASRRQIGERRVLDVFHHDLVADPMHEIDRIYAFLGRDPSYDARQAIERYAHRHASDRGHHVYDAADYGLDAPGLRAMFAEYIEHFDL